MLGIDIVKIQRIKKAIKSACFKNGVFTDSEIFYAEAKQNPAQTYAGIFAAKEAAIKALGRGVSGLRLKDVEIFYNQDGKPFAKIKKSKIEVSISHDGGFAIAIAFTHKKIDTQKISPSFVDVPKITQNDINIPPRIKQTHKGSYPSVRIIGGSPQLVGAPLLSTNSAKAALKSGAGTVKLCVPASLAPAYQKRVTEQTLMLLPDTNGFISFNKESIDKIILNADSIAIGMGAGLNPALCNIIKYICSTFSGALIIDADGLNMLATDLTVLQNHKCNVILTPHIKEFDRLSPQEGDYTKRAIDFALKHNVVLALKSHQTLITDGVHACKNVTGTACMAKGGSGDVLSGIIAAFAGYMRPLEAVKTACYLFGKSGERAQKELGSESVLASDLYLR